MSLPAPGEQDYRYLDGDDTWRYVAPENHGRLYDAAYFAGRWFVLHGAMENSEKIVLSEMNWLSWTRDGLSWQTTTLASQPYESYTKLASNGKSLLLAGIHHIARLEGEMAVPIQALDQAVYPPVMLPYPDGYAIARIDDVVWLGNDGKVEVVLKQELAQFRAGVARMPPARSLATGPFGAIESSDGKHWNPLVDAACVACDVVGMAFGNGRYLAANSESFFVSSTGTDWEEHAFEPARVSDQLTTPLDEPGEDRIASVDFTGGHFVALLQGGNVRLSRDGSNWSTQLKIPLGQIGPAPCNGRCIVAGGRILLPPIVLSAPKAPAGADRSSPYYCEYMGADTSACFSCGGATVSECREGVTCRVPCKRDSDCPAADSGKPQLVCQQTQIGGVCVLGCEHGEQCPNGMECAGGQCLYVFDDPRCVTSP